jgi:hypothetical protein
MQPSARLLLGTLALLVAGSGAAQPVRATPMTSVSPAHCVQAIAARSGADLIRCPAPLRAAIEEAAISCREAGGALQGVPEGNVWSIDVNADGRQELAFDLESNVSCQGAWSLFSCGSLGCPKGLYELRGGTWTFVGSLAATAPERVALGRATAADGHRALEVCAEDDCAVRWTYEWLGTTYDVTRGEIRGARVDIKGSVSGLYALKGATTVRARPAPNAADVGQYDAGTEVSIIGTAEGGDYYYVSPCNACESGFVPRAALTIR